MASKLSPEQIQDLREAFSLFDKNGDGHIDTKELSSVLRSLGNFDRNVKRDVLMDFDANENDRISFDEFLEVMASRVASDSDLLVAFKVFDKNGDGKISKQEFTDVLATLGEARSEAEISEIMRQSDTNQDGQIDYTEFVRLMNEGK